MRLGEFGENLEGKRLGMDVDGTCLCGWLWGYCMHTVGIAMNIHSMKLFNNLIKNKHPCSVVW